VATSSPTAPAIPPIPAALAGTLDRRAAAVVTPELVQAYAVDGAVVLRGLLSAADVALLTQGIDANLAAPGPRAIVASQPDDPGYFIEDFCRWTDIPAYQQFVTTSPLAAAAGRLMGGQGARWYHDHMLTKEPGTRQRTPWHQDQPYYNVDGRSNVSFWIPVDPVERASTLEFVAGSHLGPWLMPRTFMSNEARWFPEGSLAELPDIDADLARDPAAHRLLGWALEPGDVVAFHMLALHTAAGVAAGRRRRVFSARFLGDDMVHAPRPWKTSPDFPGLAERLAAGAPMDDPLFPLLWRRGAAQG
jgi:hypothetical protein